MKVLYEEQLVGRLVADRPGRSKIFENWGVDYCCGGNRSLRDACNRENIDITALVHDLELNESDHAISYEFDWNRATLSSLANYIERFHHAFLKTALPRLTGLIEKVRNAHGAKHPELQELSDIYGAFRADLESHMETEENSLFPQIRHLETINNLLSDPCNSIANTVAEMEMDHQSAGDALSKMRYLTNDYQLPKRGCNTYRAMLDAIEELERDMHQHVHKENNILFPKAIVREQELHL